MSGIFRQQLAERRAAEEERTRAARRALMLGTTAPPPTEAARPLTVPEAKQAEAELARLQAAATARQTANDPSIATGLSGMGVRLPQAAQVAAGFAKPAPPVMWDQHLSRYRGRPEHDSHAWEVAATAIVVARRVPGDPSESLLTLAIKVLAQQGRKNTGLLQSAYRFLAILFGHCCRETARQVMDWLVAAGLIEKARTVQRVGRHLYRGANVYALVLPPKAPVTGEAPAAEAPASGEAPAPVEAPAASLDAIARGLQQALRWGEWFGLVPRGKGLSLSAVSAADLRLEPPEPEGAPAPA